MYYMNTNVFSISPEVVVSERNFIRLNTFMEEVWGMTVERVPYYEISKMGGLMRCSTLPLIRENDYTYNKPHFDRGTRGLLVQ